jgi:hypothetical protein
MLVVTAIMVLSLCYMLKVLTLCTTNAGGTQTMGIRGRSGGRSVVPFRAHFDRGFLVSGCFDVAKPDAARIELSSWREEEARGNLNKRRETDGER